MMTYVKGVHCEESLKDLVKYLRSDKPNKPFAKIILSDFQIVESDLLQLLILHVQDKKLSFWLIILFTLLTEKPHEDLPKIQFDKINNSLL